MRRRRVLRSIAVSSIAVGGLRASSGTADAAIPELRCAGDRFHVEDDRFTKTDVTVESVDGTTLAARMYEPDDPGPHPAVLMTHGLGLTKELLHCTAARYAANGYVVLAYDSRGFGDSGGVAAVNGPKEVRDVSVLLDWLADRESVQGDDDDLRVGMDGGSYGGGIQLLAAAHDDRIDAIVPRVAWHDLVYSGAPNGAIKSGWLTALIGAGEVTTRLTGEFATSIDPRLREWYEEALVTNELPADAVAYFRRRSPAQYIDDIEAATLVVSGWYDTLFPPSEAFANYRQISRNDVDTRLVMYAGGHNIREIAVDDAQQRYIETAAMAWLDEHLKGDDGAAEDVPQVSLYSEQAGAWKTYDELPQGDPLPIRLSDVAGESSVVRNSPPLRWWEADRDAAYEVGPDGAFEVLGAPELTLAVESADADVVLFARFDHVHPNGEVTHVDDQVTPVRLRAGDQTVTLSMEPLQRTVGPAESLRLTVAAFDPFYLEEHGTATIRNDESTLTLPVVEPRR